MSVSENDRAASRVATCPEAGSQACGNTATERTRCALPALTSATPETAGQLVPGVNAGSAMLLTGSEAGGSCEGPPEEEDAHRGPDSDHDHPHN